MKVSELTRLMNDHGTKPKVRILKRVSMGWLVAYEGPPNSIDKDFMSIKVSSFTATGNGCIEIYVKGDTV